MNHWTGGSGRTVAAMILFLACGLIQYAHAYNPLQFSESAPKADGVWGQPNLTSSGAGTGLSNLTGARGVAFDSFGIMYIADIGNDRVLVFVNSDTTPDTVVGGAPDGTGSGALNGPWGLAVWSSPDTSVLFVSEESNNRVLGFIIRSPAFGGAFFPDSNADYVFGQPSFTTNTADNGGLSAVSLDNPRSLAVLDTGGTTFSLFVADFDNNRVLRYSIAKALMGETNSSIDTAADDVWGQPDTATATGATSAFGLNGPHGLAVAKDRIYIGDHGNNRVVVELLSDGDTQFNAVYGQPGFATNTGGTNRWALNGFMTVSITPSDSFLAIADLNNDRVLIHSDTTGTDTTPEYVVGDVDFNATVATNASDTLADVIEFIAFKSDTELFVSASNQNRVMLFVDSGVIPSETALPVASVKTVTTGRATLAPPIATSESYVQLNFSSSETTTGGRTALANAATTAGSNGNYAGSDYTCTFTLLSSYDTAVLELWTSLRSLRLFVGLRSDTNSLRTSGLPAGISSTDTSLQAFGASAMLIEMSTLANENGFVVGDSVTTRDFGDTFAYVLRYLISETTAARYSAAGFDTAAGSKSFRFYYADVYTGAWIEDTSVELVVRAAAQPWFMEVVVYAVTKDLPGGLGGSAGSGTNDRGGLLHGCLIERIGATSVLIRAARTWRDRALNYSFGRALARFYYTL